MTERDLELLTGFVDGELSPRERKAVLRLLHNSSEARGVLATLQQNAYALKQLPARKLPADFADQLLLALDGQMPAPMPINVAPVRHWRSARLAWATAAAMLLVAAGSLYFFLGTGPQKAPPLVSNPTRPVEVAFSLRALQEEKGQGEFTLELKREKAVRLDLRVPDSTAMLTRVRAVFGKGGIQVLMTPSAQVNSKKGKGAYAVYLENMRPEEMTTLLGKLGDDARPGTDVGTLLVHAMAAEDRKLLAGMMGVEPSAFDVDAAQEKLQLDTFIEAPKQKGQTKPPALTSAGPERTALVFALSSEGGGTVSSEVKSFLAQRQPPRSGTVQVLLTVRSL